VILLTGATGFIGSHAWVRLIQEHYDVLGVDNFSNSDRKILFNIEKILGREINFLEVDVTDSQAVENIFKKFNISCVIHFAALKSVKDSIFNPLGYYQNNINSLLVLLKVMKKYGCRNFIFSSSATVYDSLQEPPYDEDMQLKPTNPYGWSKYFSERILEDFKLSSPEFNFISLRYFNPVGAHESGLIGDDPVGVPSNLMPVITQVAAGIIDELQVFGGDWPTIDGTGIRDYIHVIDLVNAHIAAVEYLKNNKNSIQLNVGTGNGVSVLNLIKVFELVNGIKIPYKIAPRRAGDVAISYANTDRIKQILLWKPAYGLTQMCKDSWNWQKNLKEYKARTSL
jgi:UDP-glucose 4-epimerase